MQVLPFPRHRETTREFVIFNKGNMMVTKYYKKFIEMLPFLVDVCSINHMKVTHYENGLMQEHELEVKSVELLDQMIVVARNVEDVQKR